MSNPFFDQPILNSPYEGPRRHWELDQSGQPTQRVIETRRRAEFITPIPKPKKRKGAAAQAQEEMLFDEGKGLSTKTQRYDPNPIINEIRGFVDIWRNLAPGLWNVTPETQRLLQHWRHHKFSGPRPFFCQVEAAETAIWLTVARDLLTDSGSIFVQIGDENVHRVRALMDEVFGEHNFVSQINFKTTGGAGSPSGGTDTLASVNNFILWFAKNEAFIKYRQSYRSKGELTGGAAAYNKLDFGGREDPSAHTQAP